MAFPVRGTVDSWAPDTDRAICSIDREQTDSRIHRFHTGPEVAAAWTLNDVWNGWAISSSSCCPSCLIASLSS